MEGLGVGLIAAVVGGLAGAIVSGGFALFGESRQFKRGRAEQARVAKMLITNQIRLWLTETVHDLNEYSIR